MTGSGAPVRRFAATFLALAILAITFVAQPAQAKYASIVIDMETGRVLHEANADTRNYPASLTKMMTLFMLFEALERGEVSMDTRFEVSRRAAGQAPSKLGLKPGQTIRVEDCILALVTKSANDVATVVAEGLGETEYKFALDMTKRARALGMRRTTFRNASGLPNRRQLSTARDMALLGQRVMTDFPQYYHYFSRKSFSFNGRTYGNHNNLLGHYTGTDGIKTGYTRASGFNLVASVERQGRRLIGVVFGGRTAKTRDAHMETLLDQGFVRVAQIPSRAEIAATAAEAARVAQELDALNPFRNTGSAPAIAQGDADPTQQLDRLVIQQGNGEIVGAQVVSAQLASSEAVIARVARDSLVRTGPWKIQVGAFKDPDSARRLAEKAHGSLSGLGEGLSIVIDRVTGRGLYRGRLGGIEDESAARRACRALQRRDFDCLPIAPSSAKLAQN
ncbi:D-alanyl-D-alanine carboxypeptidase [Marivibrio halodurans]|uniref:D-alanyl-D-alanine carboxypeptidase n=1 Tax=Marivibrio halodurans TaxID=2039722 RepID=A0A8J7RZA0_9PROT|nr:D-alanyl-D-alanine carboxypeptidase [Marivibrio halodurans]MBP5857065.1 D-alanyl-D-alanine carboxypeptidase [Marivibrio halodurans]